MTSRWPLWRADSDLRKGKHATPNKHQNPNHEFSDAFILIVGIFFVYDSTLLDIPSHYNTPEHPRVSEDFFPNQSPHDLAAGFDIPGMEAFPCYHRSLTKKLPK